MKEQCIKIFPDANALAESYANEIVSLISSRKRGEGTFTIALSGGSTPKLLFDAIASRFEGHINWNDVHLFWVDERCVPPDDPESNYGAASKIFLSRIDIPKNNIHRIKGEDDPYREAERYASEISEFTLSENFFPQFDLVLLGMGDDGHTASIFPDRMELLRSERICEVAVHPASGQKRITITGPVINNAGSVVFLVTGKSKMKVVTDVINKTEASAKYPASFINPGRGRLFWMLDAESGAGLKG